MYFIFLINGNMVLAMQPTTPEGQERVDNYEKEVLDSIDLAVNNGLLSPEDKALYQEKMDNQNVMNPYPAVHNLGKNINFIIENGLGDEFKNMVNNKDQLVHKGTWGDSYLEPIAQTVIDNYNEKKGEKVNRCLHDIRKQEENDLDELPDMDKLD